VPVQSVYVHGRIAAPRIIILGLKLSQNRKFMALLSLLHFFRESG
jgi:hypothetical protein